MSHGRALWTIIEQFLAERFAGPSGIEASPDGVERYVGVHPAWKGHGVEGIVDALLDGARRPPDFNWSVERVGNRLRFTWKTRPSNLPPAAR
jgi:hypothetical protein